MREDPEAAPSIIGSNACPSSNDNGLSPGLFSASISFSPSEFPLMNPSAAAAGSLSQFAAALTRHIRALQTVILVCSITLWRLLLFTPVQSLSSTPLSAQRGSTTSTCASCSPATTDTSAWRWSVSVNVAPHEQWRRDCLCAGKSSWLAPACAQFSITDHGLC
jgi:hypothetical protein